MLGCRKQVQCGLAPDSRFQLAAIAPERSDISGWEPVCANVSVKRLRVYGVKCSLGRREVRHPYPCAIERAPSMFCCVYNPEAHIDWKDIIGSIELQGSIAEYADESLQCQFPVTRH